MWIFPRSSDPQWRRSACSYPDWLPQGVDEILGGSNLDRACSLKQLEAHAVDKEAIIIDRFTREQRQVEVPLAAKSLLQCSARQQTGGRDARSEQSVHYRNQLAM